jgi:ABC-2 type transport system ATP-binding protein
MSEVIRTENLTKTFGSTVAVDNLTFSVSEGEIFGLVGPDGAGKSTTMRLLASIMEPTSGDAWVTGYHIKNKSESIKENMGYMPQRFGLYNDLTVMENINFYADIYSIPKKGRVENIDELLAFSNLGPFKKRFAGNLSGGMKQKLGLVCALIHTPKILFLDEPTNGVDPVARRDFWRILDQLLSQKVTIFISTAYLDEAERCHRIGLMHKGKLLACGAPREVKQLMQESIIEVKTESPQKAIRVLSYKFGANRVNLFGNRIHIVAKNIEKASKEAQETLAEAEIKLKNIRKIEASLEDVFVTSTGKQRK